MKRLEVYLLPLFLCSCLSGGAMAGLGEGDYDGDRPRPIEVLWEWGEPALASAKELRSGVISSDGPSLSLDGLIETQVIIPNDLPLNRAYQVRLRGELLGKDGAVLPEGELSGTWQAFDPRQELVEVRLDWSPEGLGLHEAQGLRALLSAEVALATASGEEVLIHSDPFELGIKLEVAAAIAEVKPDEGMELVVSDPASPLYGARLDVPVGALAGEVAEVVALLPATQLPYHPGYRVWSGHPIEFRTEVGSKFSQDVTLTLPLFPGTRAVGAAYWDGDSQLYGFRSSEGGGEAEVRVTTQRSTIWGPTTGDDTYSFELNIESTGEPLLEGMCDGGRCPERATFAIADVRQFAATAPDLSSRFTNLTSGEPVNLDEDEPLGLCLESSWGRATLEPRDEVFGTDDLSGLPTLEDRSNLCSERSKYLVSNPFYRTFEYANVPGWGEFVSWIVPNEDYWYSGTPSTNCSQETLDALEAYLGVDPLDTREFGGLDFDDSVTQARLIFDCLWLRLDPSIESTSVAFDEDGRPSTVAADLPSELSDDEHQAFVAGTSAVLLHWSADSDGAPSSQSDAEETLRLACEDAAVLPSSARLLSLEPLVVEGAASQLRYSIDSDDFLDPEAANAVAYLRLTQADDLGSRSCIRVPWFQDVDEDDYSPFAWDPAQRDCDDGNTNSHPGALEVCDGFDNNCDSVVDEGLLVEAYPDNDNDGYALDADGDGLPDGGTATALVCPGASVDDWSTLLGDCDDGDDTVFPLAPEVCDGADQDCDHNIDEGTLQRFYADGDSDGFGTGLHQDLCPGDGAEGFAILNGDCDDQNADRFPGAPTLCNDIDEDCDGRIDEAPSEPIYADGDEDGFGSGAPLELCPSGTSAQIPGDCDDGDASRFPGAPQVPAIDLEGVVPHFFGCDPENALPLVSVDGSRPDALFVSSGASIQGHIDALDALQAHIDVHGLGERFKAPEILKLGAGYYRGSVLVEGRSLRIEGVYDGSGPETLLDGNSSACASSESEMCSTLVARWGADLRLRGVRIEGGRGSTLRSLLGEGEITSIYGGGLVAIDSAVTLESVSIVDNSAEVGAGVAVMGPNSSLEMARSDVSVNTIIPRSGLPFGGGIYVEEGEVSIFESDITLNRRFGSYQEGQGGGLVLLDARGQIVSNNIVGNGAESGTGLLALSSWDSGTLDIRNNHIQDNDAEGPGGGLLISRNGDGALEDWRVQGNVFEGNLSRGGHGGGVFVNGAPVLFRNNLLRHNVAEEGGGGIAYLGEGLLEMENVVFDQNTLGLTSSYGADLISLSSGLLVTEGSILLPLASNSVPCAIEHDESGYFGVQTPGVQSCPTPSGLGELLPPDGGESPFLAYDPSLDFDSLDLHLRPGTEIASVPEMGDVPTFRGFEETALGIGIWGGEGSRVGVGPLDLSCMRDVPIQLGGQAPGLIEGRFVYGPDNGLGEAATEAFLMDVAPGTALEVEVLDGDGDIEVALYALVEGRCGEGVVPEIHSLDIGERTELETLEGGLFILKLTPLEDWYGPYTLAVEWVSL